jgi:hypothetical protein
MASCAEVDNRRFSGVHTTQQRAFAPKFAPLVPDWRSITKVTAFRCPYDSSASSAALQTRQSQHFDKNKGFTEI